jgi:hypothetical protein
VLVAPHVRGEEIFAAVGAPLHRPGELARRMAHERILVRDAGLHAESAADVADDQAEIRRFPA